MSDYLEKWQMDIFDNLDSTDIDMVVEALEDKINSLNDEDLIKTHYVEIWQLFRRINNEEEIKFWTVKNKPKK